MTANPETVCMRNDDARPKRGSDANANRAQHSSEGHASGLSDDEEPSWCRNIG